VTVEEYAARWNRTLAQLVGEGTAENYRRSFRLHLTPLLPIALTALRRRDIRRHVVDMLAMKKGKSTARNALTALSSCLQAAVDEDLLQENPARGAGRRIFRKPPKGAALARAMTREQLTTFLEATRVVVLDTADLFATLAGVGLRIGECVALEPGHLERDRLRIHILQRWRRGALGPPKYGMPRTVDCSEALMERLWRRAEALRTVRWLFPGRGRTQPLSPGTVNRRMRIALDAAGLPRRFSVHALRHSYASLLLEETGDLVYVSRQLGHRSISITADLYGETAQPHRPEALARLDATIHRPALSAPSLGKLLHFPTRRA
jgi:integrase